MASSSKKKKPSHRGKILVVVAVLFIAGLAGFGYLSQTSELRGNETQAAEAQKPKLPPSDPLFAARLGDIVIGNENAPVTIVEYSSLSCPHCAHFHGEILPGVQKQLLNTGRAKLAFRHFALNEPALRAAQLVECVPAPQRPQFLKTLFAMQQQWAFNETFKADLKRIAAQGGIDSAGFDSCLADKEGENEILAVRQEAAMRAGVNSTPSFFINGVALTDAPSVESLAASVAKAEKAPAPPAAK